MKYGALYYRMAEIFIHFSISFPLAVMYFIFSFPSLYSVVLTISPFIKYIFVGVSAVGESQSGAFLDVIFSLVSDESSNLLLLNRKSFVMVFILADSKN